MTKMEKRLQARVRRGYWGNYGIGGFTLVELLVVIAIVAILAVVATPAYMNYINRTKQGSAVSLLLTARLEQEEFFTDNGRYASTIQCLPTFVATANTSCLSNCANCTAVSSTQQYYAFNISKYTAGSGATQAYYQVTAARKIYSTAATDVITISATTNTPTVQNTTALGFSVFKWLFQ